MVHPYVVVLVLGLIGGLGAFMSETLMWITLIGALIISVYTWYDDLKDEKRVSDEYSGTHFITCSLFVAIIYLAGVVPMYYLLTFIFR